MKAVLALGLLGRAGCAMAKAKACNAVSRCTDSQGCSARQAHKKKRRSLACVPNFFLLPPLVRMQASLRCGNQRRLDFGRVYAITVSQLEDMLMIAYASSSYRNSQFLNIHD